MKNSISKKWSNKIRKLRREKGFSQAELARKLGISRQAVSEIEQGRKRLTLERLYKILDALGYTADISLTNRNKKVRSNWHSLQAEDPGIRKMIRRARELSEKFADLLYGAYKVDKVYIVGSLVEKGGKTFSEDSDIDILVDGLDLSKLFEAKSALEIDILEPFKEKYYFDITFDLIPVESFNQDPEKMVSNKKAVYIPEKHEKK